MNKPVAPRARPEIHNKVIQILAGMGLKNGKALDAPLGPGAMALSLSELGFAVTGVDIDLSQSGHLPPSFERIRADLNGRIPLPDSTFDLVTCLEGIEHVENHANLLRELSRLMKPGGILIVSTPNVCNVEDRLNFLLRGSHYRFISKSEMDRNGSGFDHQNLITSVELRQVIDWTGLEFLQAHSDVTKWKQLVFLAPVWLLVKFYGLLQSPRRRQKYLMDLANSNEVLVGGNTMIFVARKPRG